MNMAKPVERKYDNRLLSRLWPLGRHNFKSFRSEIHWARMGRWRMCCAPVIRWVIESKTQSQSRCVSAWNEDDIVEHIAQQQVTRVCVCQLQPVFACVRCLRTQAMLNLYFSAPTKSRYRTNGKWQRWSKGNIYLKKRGKNTLHAFQHLFNCMWRVFSWARRRWFIKTSFRLAEIDTQMRRGKQKTRFCEKKKVTKRMKTHVDERQNEFHFDSFDVTRDTNRFVLILHTFRVISCHTPECVVSNGRQSFGSEEIAFRCRWNANERQSEWETTRRNLTQIQSMVVSMAPMRATTIKHLNWSISFSAQPSTVIRLTAKRCIGCIQMFEWKCIFFLSLFRFDFDGYWRQMFAMYRWVAHS